MKFFSIAGIALAITSVAAQLTAPMQNYNVSSPVSNGPYVVGQVLPCTVQLFENVLSDITLSISLDSAAAGSNVSIPISQNVEVSKATASAKQNGNVTYYEHSINYQIPATVTPGPYKVVFLDSKTATHLDVPINVLPAASAPVNKNPGATGASTSPSPSGAAIYKNNGITMSPSKAILALACVAVMASML